MAATDLSERLTTIETALRSRLGIRLDDLDPHDVVLARQERLKEAGKQAAELVKKAYEEQDLTAEQRVRRIERALGI